MNLFTLTVRPLIFALLCLFTTCLVAQPVYRPTAVEGAHWMMVNSFIDDPDVPCCTWAFVLTAEGDTTVGEYTYKKVYRRIIENWEESPTSPARPQPPYVVTRRATFWGLLRDDLENRTVHGRFTSSVTDELGDDLLLHDYSLEVGDTLRGAFFDTTEGAELTLTEIVYEQVFGMSVRTHKAFGSYYFEGIGASEWGPSSGGSNFITNNYISYLFNYCQGTDADCQIETSTPVIDLENNVRLTIFPNPVLNQLNLALSQPSATAIEVKLTDGFGRVVRHTTLRESTSWSLAGLPAGVYFVVLAQGNGTVSRKIIKR